MGSKSRNNSNIPNRLSVADRTALLAVTGTREGEVVLQNDIGLLYTWTETQGIDNGGTIINVGTGSWIAKYDGAVNVKWFGAKGDGVTDDTVAIQAAIDYCQPLHLKLYIPDGIFIITSPLIISDIDDFSIEGAGHGDFVNDNAETTIKASGTLDSIFRFSYTSLTTYGIRLSNMRLDGVNTTTYGIRADNFFPACKLDKINIDNVATGVTLYESCWGWHFNEVFVRVSSIGFDLRDKNHNAYFSGCVTRSVSASTPSTGYRIGVTASSSSITFVGCDFEMDSPTTAQLYIINARAITVSGCYFESRGAPYCILIGDSGFTNTPTGVSITGSYFNSAGATYTIRLNNYNGVTITGNSFTGVASFDVDVTSGGTIQRALAVDSNSPSTNGLMSDISYSRTNIQTVTQALSITADIANGANINLVTDTDYANPIVLSLFNSVSAMQQGGIITYYVNNTSTGDNDIAFDILDFSNVSPQNLLTTQQAVFTFMYFPQLGKFVELARQVF